jgi:hypothetical protein
MSMPASLDKSTIRRCEYVGYNSRGYGCRILKQGKGKHANWFITVNPNDTAGMCKYVRTLREAAELVKYI